MGRRVQVRAIDGLLAFEVEGIHCDSEAAEVEQVRRSFEGALSAGPDTEHRGESWEREIRTFDPNQVLPVMTDIGVLLIPLRNGDSPRVAVVRELARLSRENRELRERLSRRSA